MKEWSAVLGASPFLVWTIFSSRQIRIEKRKEGVRVRRAGGEGRMLGLAPIQQCTTSRFSLLSSVFSLLPSPFSLLPSPFSLLSSLFSLLSSHFLSLSLLLSHPRLLIFFLSSSLFICFFSSPCPLSFSLSRIISLNRSGFTSIRGFGSTRWA